MRMRRSSVGIGMLALVVLAVWWLASGSGEGGPAHRIEGRTADGAGPGFVVGDVEVVEELSVEAEGVAAVPVPPDAPPAAVGGTDRARLIVRVRDVHRQPVADIVVLLLEWARPNPLAEEREGRAGSEGRVEFSDVTPGTLQLAADRGGGLTLEIAAGETREVDLELPAGVRVTGQVVDLAGVPVPGAAIWLSDYGNPQNGRAVTLTDARGEFDLRDVGAWRTLAVFAEGHRASQRFFLGERPTEAPWRIVLEDPAGRLTGRVVDDGDAPVAGARVTVGWRTGFGRGAGPDGVMREGPPPLSTRTDEDGGFAFATLPPGPTSILVRAPGHAIWKSSVMIPDHGEVEQKVVLGPEGRVEGRVADERGRPLGDIFVAAGSYGAPDASMAVTTLDGRYALGELSAGTVSINASHREFLGAQVQLRVVPGETIRQDFALASGLALGGRVADPSGHGLPELMVVAKPTNGPGSWAARTEADGRFLVPSVPAGVYDVVVHAPGHTLPVGHAPGVAAGTHETLIVLDTETTLTTTVQAEVVDAHGRPVEDVDAFLQRPWSELLLSMQPDGAGRFTVADILPGDYVLTLRRAGATTASSHEVEVTQDVPCDLGVFRLGEASEDG